MHIFTKHSFLNIIFKYVILCIACWHCYWLRCSPFIYSWGGEGVILFHYFGIFIFLFSCFRLVILLFHYLRVLFISLFQKYYSFISLFWENYFFISLYLRPLISLFQQMICHFFSRYARFSQHLCSTQTANTVYSSKFYMVYICNFIS